MSTKSNLEAVRDTLDELMAADERIFVLGEDVEEGGVFRATEGLLAKYGSNRIMDAPLAESGIVGVSIGASINGLLPVAEIQFADFILPAVNQIISEAARLRYRSGGDWHCPIVIRAPYGGGVHGGLYHSQSMEQIFAHQPGLKVLAPSTPYDIKGLLRAAVLDPDPVLFFEHKRTYRLIRGEVPDEPYELPIGRAEVRRTGEDVTIISYGLAMHMCLEAANQVAGDGIECTVVDLRSLRPLDVECILTTARATGKILVVHEDYLTGGIGGEVVALIAEQAFEYLDAPIMRLAGPDVPAMPYNHVLEEFFMLSPAKVAEAVRRLAAY